MRKILLLLLLITSFAASSQTKWPLNYDLTSFKGTVSIGKPAWPSFAVSTVYLEIGDNSGPGYYNFAKTGKATFKYYTNTVGETYYLTTDANGELKLALVEWDKISDVPANLTTGTGTAGYIPKWTGANTLGNSLIQDNGTTVSVAGGLTATSLTATGLTSTFLPKATTGGLLTNSLFSESGTIATVAATLRPTASLFAQGVVDGSVTGKGLNGGYFAGGDYAFLMGYNYPSTGFTALHIDGAPLYLNRNSSGSPVIINSATNSGHQFQVTGTSLLNGAVTVNGQLNLGGETFRAHFAADAQYFNYWHDGGSLGIHSFGYTSTATNGYFMINQQAGHGITGIGSGDQYNFKFQSSWANASGTANNNYLWIRPTINNTGTYSGTVRGIYYNPTLTSTTGTTHIAFENTAGDNIFNSTSGTSTFYGKATIKGGSALGGVTIRDYNGHATNAGIYTSSVTPSTTNVGVLLTNNSAWINGNTDVAGGMAVMGLDGTGYVAVRTGGKVIVGPAASGATIHGEQFQVEGTSYLNGAVTITGTTTTGNIEASAPAKTIGTGAMPFGEIYVGTVRSLSTLRSGGGSINVIDNGGGYWSQWNGSTGNFIVANGSTTAPTDNGARFQVKGNVDIQTSVVVGTTLNAGGAITATANGHRLGNYEILTSGTTGTTGFGLTVSSGISYQSQGTANIPMHKFTHWAGDTYPQALNGGTGNTYSYVGIRGGWSIPNLSGVEGHMLDIRPTYNFAGAVHTSTVRGIYYKPTLTDLTNATHIAIENTTGDNRFNSTSGNSSFGGNVTVTGNISKTGGTSSQALMADGSVQTVTSGTYTPTLTGVSNVTSISSATSCQYMRVGNVVTVSGYIQLVHTSNTTETTVRVTLPIASALSETYHVSGSGAGISGSYAPMGVRGDISNSEALLVFVPTNAAGFTTGYSFTFTYRIN